MLSSPQHRRLSLSAESQRGLALKATDFFSPLASHTKEGQFVNYLLVSAQQKVLSLKQPPLLHLILLKFDYKDWKRRRKKRKQKKNRWRPHSAPWMALSGCLFKLWQSTSVSVGSGKRTWQKWSLCHFSYGKAQRNASAFLFIRTITRPDQNHED